MFFKSEKVYNFANKNWKNSFNLDLKILKNGMGEIIQKNLIFKFKINTYAWIDFI